MSFFEDLGTNLKDVATTVGEKASNICDISKLNYIAGTIKAEIKKETINLGNLVYEEYQLDEAAKINEFAEVINHIGELKLQLKNINNLISEAKKK